MKKFVVVLLLACLCSQALAAALTSCAMTAPVAAQTNAGASLETLVFTVTPATTGATTSLAITAGTGWDITGCGTSSFSATGNGWSITSATAVSSTGTATAGGITTFTFATATTTGAGTVTLSLCAKAPTAAAVAAQFSMSTNLDTIVACTGTPATSAATTTGTFTFADTVGVSATASSTNGYTNVKVIGAATSTIAQATVTVPTGWTVASTLTCAYLSSIDSTNCATCSGITCTQVSSTSFKITCTAALAATKAICAQITAGLTTPSVTTSTAQTYASFSAVTNIDTVAATGLVSTVFPTNVNPASSLTFTNMTTTLTAGLFLTWYPAVSFSSGDTIKISGISASYTVATTPTVSCLCAAGTCATTTAAGVSTAITLTGTWTGVVAGTKVQCQISSGALTSTSTAITSGAKVSVAHYTTTTLNSIEDGTVALGGSAGRTVAASFMCLLVAFVAMVL